MPNVIPGHTQRWDSLDFWRGYLLCTIFVNHVPGNAFEPLTQKNFGFSDSAEGFVFLSGLSLALAHGRRIDGGEWRIVVRNLAGRVVRLYGLHVLLSLLGVAIFAAGAAWLGTESLMQMHGRDLAVAAPAAMLLGVVSLGHQFGYFNILPMYVLLLAMAPAFLWMARRSPWPMLGASALLYLLAVTQGWTLPTWPEKGTWFFDPFAWQFLMAIGVAVGLSARRAPFPRISALRWPAAIVIVFALFSVTNGFSLRPGFGDWVRDWAPIDKGSLGLGRLLHFLSVAYLIYMFRVAEGLRLLPIFKPVCAIGRNALPMFALLSLLAALGQVMTHAFAHLAVAVAATMVTGFVVLVLVARHLDERRLAAPRLSPAPTNGGWAWAMDSALQAWQPALKIRQAVASK